MQIMKEIIALELTVTPGKQLYEKTMYPDYKSSTYLGVQIILSFQNLK
ncbi:MAG: hypothetical protein WCL46_03435 [Chlorobium sp.]